MTFQVPDNTSTSSSEYKPDKYVVPFATELVNFILAGKKLTTYRYGDKYGYLKEGDTVSIQNSDTKEIVAKALIVKKLSTTFKQLPTDDGSHEAYRDKEHQRRVLSGYYAYIGRELDDNDPFLVFDFELIG